MPGALFAGLLLAFAPQSSTFQTLSQHAQQARDAKELPKALELYEKALKLKPDWDEGLWNVGSIAYDLDRYDECAPAFHRLASLRRDSAPAWTMAGLCDYRLRHYDAALASFTQVERLNFQDPPELAHAAQLHLALVLTKNGSFERAITVLTELTRADHKSPEIVVATGIAGLRRPWLPFEVPEADRDLVMKLGDAMATAMEMDYKTATEKFDTVAQEYPAEPNVHFRFGAFLNMQDPERGVDEIRKALDLAPEHLLALVGLAAIYLKQENLPAALEYARKAVGVSPGDFSTHVILGRALLAKDDAAGAAAELETAVKLAPQNPEARYNLASAYSRLGRKDDAARQRAEFKRLEQATK